MSIDISAEIIIDRPKDDVASFVTNPGNDPAWIGGIVESEMLTDPPLGQGTKVRRVAKFLGRRMEYVPEVVEYVPSSRLVMRTDKPFDMMIAYEFEEMGGGTRVRLQVQGEGSGFFRLADPLMGPAVRRNVSNDLKALKRLLESRASAT